MASGSEHQEIIILAFRVLVACDADQDRGGFRMLLGNGEPLRRGVERKDLSAFDGFAEASDEASRAESRWSMTTIGLSAACVLRSPRR